MSYLGRPRVPQPNGTQRPFFWPPRMGNPFRFEQNSYQQGMGPAPRFPRPDTEEPRNETPISPDPYRRGGKFYRPSSTTLSDTDSDREKENEALRMRLLSLENEAKKVAEEKQRLADELNRLKNQQQQLPSQPQMETRTAKPTVPCELYAISMDSESKDKNRVANSA